MTLVKVLITQYNAQGSKVGATGQLTFTPTRSQIIPGDTNNLVLPTGFAVPLVDGAANVHVDPSTNEWVWKVSTFIKGSPAIPDKHVTVPDVSSINYTDLAEVDPATFEPVPQEPDPIWHTYVGGLELTAQDAAQSAADMAASLTPVKTSVESSQAAALVSENKAFISATSASVSAQAAAQSKAAAQTSASAALASEQASAASQSAAAASATSAASSASTATTKATEASASATAAQTSATASATSAATSTTQAGIATQKASDAGTSAFNAGQSASVAWGHANDSGDSATASEASRVTSASSETNAASSASASASSATAAQTARTGAETARTGAEAAQATTATARDYAVAVADGFSIGTVTTGDPNGPASATITGAAAARKLNLDLPKGPIGPATTLTVIGTTTGPDLSGPQGLKGDPGDPSAYELRGAVPPNGAITANPGTYYTDTSGTNGAWRWLKTSGTGNTGWIVVIGDTGWRAFSGSTITARRFNNTLEFYVGSSAATGSNALTGLPAGFSPSLPAYTVPLGGSVMVYHHSAGFVNIISGSTGQYIGWQMTTGNAWPTTLPGTPA